MLTVIVRSHGGYVAVSAPDGVLSVLADEFGAVAEVRVDADGGPVEAGADVRFRLLRNERGDGGLLTRDDETVSRGETLGVLGRMLISEVHLAIAVHARDAVFVHAGVVTWNGRAIVIPGRSMSGKSTLVHALVGAGATYYSDEYAVLDHAGFVHPYAKPLSIRREDGTNDHVAPKSAGLVGSEPAPVGLIVSTYFDPIATWEPEVIEGSRAALPLIDNTVAARIQPARMLEAAAATISSGASCIKGARPDAGQVIADLKERVSAESTVGSQSD